LFGLAALVLGAVILPESADPDAYRVDTAGALLGAAVLATLVFAIITAETAGFGAPRVIGLLLVSAVAAVAFFWREARAAHPLIDLRYLRVARFATANVVAFCTYFATFAIFFFTALYLYEVVGLSGYRIALVFLPMTVLMIVASLLTGRWLDVIGLRWAMFGGCVLFGAGLWLSDLNLSPHPHYLPLLVALALTGLGIGATVVPITSSALSAVPPERSGMAASATNTSREVGAVTGVAVLGALVNGQLNASIASQLRALGLPASIQSIVIRGVETGEVPSSGSSSGVGPAGQGALVQKVIDAAYTAFHDGLRDALFLSAGLVLAAGLLAVVTLRAQPADPGPSGSTGRSDE
jgi:MFS family permease